MQWEGRIQASLPFQRHALSFPSPAGQLPGLSKKVAWVEQESSIEKGLHSNGHRPTISHGHIAYMLREHNLFCWTNMRHCIDYISASWRTWTHFPSQTPSLCSSSRWDGPSTTLKRFEQIVAKKYRRFTDSLTTDFNHECSKISRRNPKWKSWFLLNA